MPIQAILSSDSGSTSKIADADAGGLAATADSLAYAIGEIERHFHSGARWFETALIPSGETHVADRIGSGGGPFQIDAGNNTWGDWIQIIGSEDTPVDAGKAYYDPHQMIVEDSERAATYFIQFTRGASGTAGYAAGTYTELVYSASVQKETGIIDIQTGRAPAGAMLWARCMAPGENTGTLDFYLGVHEYEG